MEALEDLFRAWFRCLTDIRSREKRRFQAQRRIPAYGLDGSFALHGWKVLFDTHTNCHFSLRKQINAANLLPVPVGGNLF